MSDDPTRCPQCGRPAHFSYSSEEEAQRASPLCWGYREQDCPGYEAWAAPSSTRAKAMKYGREPGEV